jgi:uncharacterized protein
VAFRLGPEVTVPFAAPPAWAEGHRVAMRDGVRLATDVYLPPAPARLTAVLIRTPYDKAHPDTLIPDIASRLTAAGFGVVAQDVRGKIRSEGKPVPFAAEVADGADTCEWITRQPWSDGTVACWGNSYYGFTAWAAAASRHPAVRAVVTRLVTTDIGGELTHRNGVFRHGLMVEWLRSTWSGHANIAEQIDWAHCSLAELLSGLPPPAREIATLPPGSPRWAELCFAGRDPGHGRLPAMHCAGWFDPFQAGQLADWRRAHHGPTPQYLIASATDHQDDLFLPDADSPDHLADPVSREAMLDRSLSPVIDFLRGGTAFPVRWELAGGGWQHGHTWPPSRAGAIRLYLTDAARSCTGADGGGLSPAPDRRAATVRWEHDSANPVPCLDRNWWRPLLDVPDERAVEQRPDVPTFTTDAWPDGLRLAGPVSLHAPVISTARPAQLVIKLCDVAPGGRSRRILEAPGRLIGTAADVHLGDVGYLLRPGHRLRVQIASACFPHYLPLTQPPRSLQHLQTGGTRAAYLSLTVLPASLIS